MTAAARCTCVEDVVCGACMTGGAATPPADDVREAVDHAVRAALSPLGIDYVPWWKVVHAVRDSLLAEPTLDVRPRGTVTAAARVLADPDGGCSCEPFDQDAGGGYTEHLLEYEPDCPEHSTHLYDPRKGEWIIDPRETVTDADGVDALIADTRAFLAERPIGPPIIRRIGKLVAALEATRGVRS